MPKAKAADQSLALAQQLGRKIREHRLAKGLTQMQLAAAADMAQSSIYQIEHSLVLPSLVRLLKIADALDVSVAALLDHEVSTISVNKRKLITDMEAELLTALANIPDLAGKRLLIHVAKRFKQLI